MTMKMQAKVKIYKKLIFEAWIYVNFQCQILLTLISNHKILRGSKFSSNLTNDNHHCFAKFCSICYIFQVKWKTKMVINLRDYSTFQKCLFQKCFTDYDGAVGIYKKKCGRRLEVVTTSSDLVTNIFIKILVIRCCSDLKSAALIGHASRP